MEEKDQFNGDIKHDLEMLNSFEPTKEEQEESDRIWAEIAAEEKILQQKILKSNERIFNAIKKVKGEKYLTAVKECLDELYEDCSFFSLPPDLSLEKKPNFKPQKEDWGEFDHVFVDQYCNGGMEGDSFAGYFYIPLKENLYLKTHYNM